MRGIGISEQSRYGLRFQLAKQLTIGNKEIRYKGIRSLKRLIPLHPYTPISLYLLLLAVSILLTACGGELSQKEKQQVQSALNDSLLATTETWGVDMEIIENGMKKVRLTGSYSATFNTDDVNETRIKGPVFIDVFDTAGAVKTEVNANRAIYRSEEAVFELFGDVNVRSRSGKTLYSEYLKWDQNENRISTPKYVVITTAEDSLAGTGFRGAADLSRYTILNPSGQVVLD